MSFGWKYDQIKRGDHSRLGDPRDRDFHIRSEDEILGDVFAQNGLTRETLGVTSNQLSAIFVLYRQYPQYILNILATAKKSKCSFSQAQYNEPLPTEVVDWVETKQFRIENPQMDFETERMLTLMMLSES